MSGNLLVKHIHPEKSQEPFTAVVFHPALVRQLLDEDAVGGHTGKLKFRKFAGLALGNGAGGAQRAAADAHQKARDSLGPEALRQADLPLVVGGLGLFDGRLVAVVGDLPNGFQHQGLPVGENPVLHVLRGSAGRGTGVVDAILPAEIFLAVFPEGGVEYDVLGFLKLYHNQNQLLKQN